MDTPVEERILINHAVILALDWKMDDLRDSEEYNRMAKLATIQARVRNNSPISPLMMAEVESALEMGIEGIEEDGEVLIPEGMKSEQFKCALLWVRNMLDMEEN